MKRYDLGNGVTAFKWRCLYDPRGYVPPKGYTAEATLVEYHPNNGLYLGRSEWWTFLTKKGA